MIDRMRYLPLSNPDRIAPLRAWWRTTATWLSLSAFIANGVLPAALVIFADLADPSRGALGAGICGGSSGDAADKGKPGLLAQHCPLCTIPAAPLARSPSLTVPCDAAEGGLLQPRTALALDPRRHGSVQARAPPPAG